MTKTIKLSPSDRSFFTLISRAALCNPFSDDRIALDLKIAKCSPKTSNEVRLKQVIQKLREHITGLESKSKANIRLFQGDERLIHTDACASA